MDEGLDVSTLIELLEAFEQAYGSRSKVYLKTVKTTDATPATTVTLLPKSVNDPVDEPRNLLIK